MDDDTDDTDDTDDDPRWDEVWVLTTPVPVRGGEQ